ncbi:unnamed protein product, partial [Hapterophycus canaliculatus]
MCCTRTPAVALSFYAEVGRFVIYEKGIEDKVDIGSPADVGGLKSEEYFKMNPHGKVGYMLPQ